MTATKITSRWSTLFTRGYQGSVSKDENRSAHGGVCHTQLRRTKDGRTIARKVNTNGRHEEIGESWEPTASELADLLKRAEAK